MILMVCAHFSPLLIATAKFIIDAMAITYARLLGALINVLPSDVAAGLIRYTWSLIILSAAGTNRANRSRVLTAHFTKASVLALNAILLEAPKALTENFGEETASTISQGISNSVSSCLNFE